MLNTAAADGWADRIVLLVKAAIGSEMAPLRERLAVLESKSAVPGPAGPAGPAGPTGPAGADGFGCDDITATQDPNASRLITLAFKRGDQTRTIGTLRLQTPRYCGIYEGGKAYAPGDQVTHKGSQWHCHTATSAIPGDGASGWTLQVKCGRDGKDAGGK